MLHIQIVSDSLSSWIMGRMHYRYRNEWTGKWLQSCECRHICAPERGGIPTWWIGTGLFFWAVFAPHILWDNLLRQQRGKFYFGQSREGVFTLLFLILHSQNIVKWAGYVGSWIYVRHSDIRYFSVWHCHIWCIRWSPCCNIACSNVDLTVTSGCLILVQYQLENMNGI